MDLTVRDDSKADNNKLFNAQLTDFSECVKYHQFLAQSNLTDIRKVMSILFKQALETIDNRQRHYKVSDQIRKIKK